VRGKHSPPCLHASLLSTTPELDAVDHSGVQIIIVEDLNHRLVGGMFHALDWLPPGLVREMARLVW
jgi:hypothetical protein